MAPHPQEADPFDPAPTPAPAGDGPSLQARALRALSRREYTQAELRRKLAPHAESEAQLEVVLQWAQDKGFLSDERAAASLVRQKAGRYGSARIRQDLQAKGVDRELIDATLAPLQEDEWARAQAVWQARFGQLDLQGLDWQEKQKQRAKQARFMTSRGFAPDIVRKLLADGD